MSDYEKLAELISRTQELAAQKSEEQKALVETIDKVKNAFKLRIDGVLTALEKDIELGKVTDNNTIQGIRRLREQYNIMFVDEK